MGFSLGKVLSEPFGSSGLSRAVGAVAPVALGAYLGPGGAALGGGLLGAEGAALAVGGAYALGTGSLEKGLMAGLGAYGGAGLGAAAGKGISDAAAQKALMEAEADAATWAGGRGVDMGDVALNPETKLTLGESAQAGIKGLGSLGAKDLAKYGFMAAAPVAAAMSGQQGLSGIPTGQGSTGYIRPKYYDYRTQRYYDLPAVKASDWGSQSIGEYRSQYDPTVRAAEGGLMDQSPLVDDQELSYQNSPVVRMADGGVSDADVQSWFAANPGATDAQIAAAMSQYSVSPEQVARVTGADTSSVQSRYEAALPTATPAPAPEPTPAPTYYEPTPYSAPTASAAPASGATAPTYSDAEVLNWFKLNPGATDTQIAAAMKESGVTADQIARVTGVAAPDVQSRYDTAAQYTPYSQQDIETYLAKNPELLLTGSGLAEAAKQFNANPADIQAAIAARGADYGLSDAAIYTLSQGKGLNDLSQNVVDYIEQNYSKLTPEEIKKAMEASGVSYTDINRALTGKYAVGGDEYGTSKYFQPGTAFTGGAQEWAIKTGQGTQVITDSINQWLSNNAALIAADPAAARLKAERDMAANGMNLFDVKMATGKTLDELFREAGPKEVSPTGTTATGPTTYDNGAVGPYGSGPATGIDYKGREVSIATPGDKIINPDQSVTVSPNIPGRPYGGFTGMEQVKSAYTAGGGRLGQMLTPTQEYKNTGTSKEAYDYLFGRAPWKAPAAPAFEAPANPKWIMRNGVWTANPNYVTPTGLNLPTVSNVTTGGGGVSGETPPLIPTATGTWTSPSGKAYLWDKGTNKWVATGGTDFAAGGLSEAHFNLGGYSDGGRLLKGPGDGVSDSIPATIGNKQPARLADGEFVIPARIVSEIGNGSTEAGARKLYAMMDRVQQARKQTVGKGRGSVAKNTRADKYLPK